MNPRFRQAGLLAALHFQALTVQYDYLLAWNNLLESSDQNFRTEGQVGAVYLGLCRATPN